VIPFPISAFGFSQTRDLAQMQQANHDREHITASPQLVVLPAGGWPRICGTNNEKNRGGTWPPRSSLIFACGSISWEPPL
jgi:hypothetical protein